MYDRTTARNYVRYTLSKLNIHHFTSTNCCALIYRQRGADSGGCTNDDAVNEALLTRE